MIPFIPNGILSIIWLNFITFHNTHGVPTVYFDNNFPLLVISYHIHTKWHWPLITTQQSTRKTHSYVVKKSVLDTQTYSSPHYCSHSGTFLPHLQSSKTYIGGMAAHTYQQAVCDLGHLSLTVILFLYRFDAEPLHLPPTHRAARCIIGSILFQPTLINKTVVTHRSFFNFRGEINQHWV